MIQSAKVSEFNRSSNTNWTGANRISFDQLGGLAHLVQSIEDILTTHLGERMYREDYGSRLFELVDRPVNDDFEIDAALYVSQALNKLVMGENIEPRFELRRVTCQQAQPGQVGLNLLGVLTGVGASRNQASTSQIDQSGSLSLSRQSVQYVKRPQNNSTTKNDQISVPSTGSKVGTMVMNEAARRLGPTRLMLDHMPLPGTLRFRVNGLSVTAASLEIEGRAVRLDFALEDDDQVEVDYWALMNGSDLSALGPDNFLSIEGLIIGRSA